MSVFADHSVYPTPNIRWFAVKVRSRCEEVIASALRDKHFEVLNPSSTELRQYSDRVRKVSCALFPGYVFVAMDSDKMLRLVSTEGVHYVVRSGSGIQPLCDQEVHAIRSLCKMDALQSQSCRPSDFLRVGQRVRIEVGPLAGLEGVLVRVRDVERIVVSVESLHSAVSIEIGHTEIRLLDSPVEPAQGVFVTDTYRESRPGLR